MEKGLYLAVEAVETTTQNLDLLLKEKNLGIPHSRKKVNNFFNKLDNKEDISKILYFDLLTANIDRYRNLGNLIFKKTNTGNYILAIDFGYCFFGPYWSSEEYYHDLIFERTWIKLVEGNLITTKLRYASNNLQIYSVNLTYQGHEYLNNIRDNKIWKNTKAEID